MTLQKWAILIMGSMGISHFLSDPTEILIQVISKTLTHIKFQFEKTSNTKVIAKKPLTNLYEMNRKIWIIWNEQ